MNLSNENLKKLELLKKRLLQDGYEVVEDDNATENKEYSIEEEKALLETMKIWSVSKRQAEMIYQTVGSLNGLVYANSVRKMQKEKAIPYKKLESQLVADGAFIRSVENLEEKYFTNYEAILGGELRPAETMVLRNSNEQIEEILSERRPKLNATKMRYDAVGAVIYYGLMADLQAAEVSFVQESERKQQENRPLPGYRTTVEVDR